MIDQSHAISSFNSVRAHHMYFIVEKQLNLEINFLFIYFIVVSRPTLRSFSDLKMATTCDFLHSFRIDDNTE